LALPIGQLEKIGFLWLSLKILNLASSMIILKSRDGRFFIYENFISTGANVSTNYNRTFAIDLRANIGTLFETGRDLFTYDFEIEPRVRVNDHLLLVYQL
jgi:hypothetical protein